MPIRIKIEICVDEDEGSFHAYCPALKGLHTSGDTEAEALNNAKYAIHAYLGSLAKHNEPLPVGILSDNTAPDGVVCQKRYVENMELAPAL